MRDEEKKQKKEKRVRLMHSSIKLKANLGRCGSLGRPENKCTVEPLFMVFVALAAAPQIFHFDEYR